MPAFPIRVSYQESPALIAEALEVMPPQKTKFPRWHLALIVAVIILLSIRKGMGERPGEFDWKTCILILFPSPSIIVACYMKL